MLIIINSYLIRYDNNEFLYETLEKEVEQGRMKYPLVKLLKIRMFPEMNSSLQQNFGTIHTGLIKL